MKFLKDLMQKPWFRYLLTLIAGVAIGAIFYPTKRIEEREKRKYEEELAKVYEHKLLETSKVLELYTTTVTEFREYKINTEKKINILTVQNSDLKSKQKTSFYKLVKPDGTIEIKKFSESEVNESTQVITQIQEEFRQKVASIEAKWSKIHSERIIDIKRSFQQKEEIYQKKIETLEKSKITTINEKHFGAEIGVNTEKQFYLHGTSDLFGPVFMGLHGASDREFNDKSIGVGLGIKF